MSGMIFGLLAGDPAKPIPLRVDSSGRLIVTVEPRVCLGRETLTVPTSGSPAVLTIPTGAAFCTIQADGGAISITLDGTTPPTASVGTRIDDGVIFPVDTDLTKVKLFGRSTTAAQVAYFNRP